MAESPAAQPDQQAQLAELIAQASLQYSLKNYDAAAEFYSEATALQAELNGEMAPENADLLYAYGRCLYHVGVANSNVLGGKVAGEKQSNESAKPKKKKTTSSASAAATEEPASESQKVAEEAVTQVVEAKDGLHQQQQQPHEKSESSTANKPYFQFTGDENWVSDESDVEDGEEDGEADGEGEGEDDDFATAYEILDLARVLLLRKIEAIKGDQDTDTADKGKGKGKESESEPAKDSEEIKQIKERLADTHDLQAEISLENERFTDAVTDSRAALDLKRELFPPESSLLAEAHFKLALALEFASVTTAASAANDDDALHAGQDAQQVDMAMREDAAKEMEAAINSCRLRVKKEEASLTAGETSKAEKEKLQRGIADVKDMILEMEQRLQDLRQPPISLSSSDLLRNGGVSSSALGPAGAPDPTDANPLTSILGAVLGEGAAAQQARVAEATASARDLSGMVRKKARPSASASASASATTKKRGPENAEGDGEGAKKSKTDG